MRLRIGDPTLLGDLRAHLARSGFAVELLRLQVK
jgi:hypothetical protein